MEILEIEKLKQFISRTDMTGNEKVNWLINFIDKREAQLYIADVSNCLVKSNYIEKSHEVLNKYNKGLSSVVKLAIVESWQDGFEKAIKYISENNC